MATASAFIAELQAMTVTGVTRHYDEPVLNLVSADLPALVMLNFGVSASPSTKLGDCPPDKVRRCDLMIAISSVNQSTAAANYALYKSLADNLETALDALATYPYFRYDIRTTTQQEIAALGYWGIFCTVEGADRRAF